MLAGPEAKAAYYRSNAFVKAGEYEAALSVEMLPSDRALIGEKIAAAKQAASAKGNAE